MPTTITLPKAIENGTMVIIVSFTNENNQPIPPKTMTWTLTDMVGNIINSRHTIPFGVMSTTLTAVLSASDLALTTTHDAKRVFTIEGTYDSDYGTNLPFNDQATFTIQNLIHIVTA
jgi:hypothetical protein